VLNADGQTVRMILDFPAQTIQFIANGVACPLIHMAAAGVTDIAMVAYSHASRGHISTSLHKFLLPSTNVTLWDPWGMDCHQLHLGSIIVHAGTLQVMDLEWIPLQHAALLISTQHL
jgi:hypothetical protein